jgi:acyl-CoA synthetase (AMP-forming)/AMP-acid ligase II
MAAVIGIPHQKWGERPLLIAQPAPGASPTKESVLEFLETQVAKIWLPDDVVFVDALPIGATGKGSAARNARRPTAPSTVMSLSSPSCARTSPAVEAPT